MKLRKFLKFIDPIGLNIEVYINCEDKPSYSGPVSKMPWNLGELEIGNIDPLNLEEPVDFWIAEKENNELKWDEKKWITVSVISKH